MKRRGLLGLSAWLIVASTGAQAEDAGGLAEPIQEATSAAEIHSPLQQGLATWYGGQRWQGRRTANGERFDRHALTAAHPTLPLGTKVRVLHPLNGREVIVRINDRGPRSRRFIIDLSEAAAERLGFRRKGWTHVELHLSTPAHADPEDAARS